MVLARRVIQLYNWRRILRSSNSSRSIVAIFPMHFGLCTITKQVSSGEFGMRGVERERMKRI